MIQEMAHKHRTKLCWTWFLATIAALAVLCSGREAHAQRFERRTNTKVAPRRSREVRTEVTVEIVSGEGGAGLKAQQWRQVFERLDVNVRIARGLPGDVPETKERLFGRLRQVTVTGRLEADGRLIFESRRFTQGDVAQLREWLRELKTYGSQGAPTGKPLWGLNAEQFHALYAALTQPLVREVEGLQREAALKQFGLPAKYEVRMTTAAKQHVRAAANDSRPVRDPLRGIGTGTALAILLSDFGLGFRPSRTPKGTIELAIVPLTDAAKVWPIGWEPKRSRKETAPKLFELGPVELTDVAFLDVLNAVSVTGQVPIYLNRYRVAEKGIDTAALKVSYPRRNASLSQVLRGITVPHRMTQRLRIDEQGRAFVWITTLEPGRPVR
jgi:hypothetical protein